MSQRSGFVPIDFRLAGRILLAIGILVVAVTLIANWIGMSGVPVVSVPLGVILAAIGAYLLWVASRSDRGDRGA